MAKLLVVASELNALPSVSEYGGPFCTLKLFESGACCAIWKAIVL